MKSKTAMGLALILMLTGLFSGCGKSASPTQTPVTPSTSSGAPSSETAAVPAEPVTLTVTGGWHDCVALDDAARAFTALYPNCTVVYEYLQDYYASAEKRLASNTNIDLFFTTNIQDSSPFQPYVLDLNAQPELDLSDTFEGLTSNFRYREEGTVSNKQYAIPLGGEMRGLFVNKTLLDSVGAQVPKDQASLLAVCETLKSKGYIPFHGNPGMFSQILLYPWVCNSIANAEDYDAVYNMVNTRQAGISELLREPMELQYLLVEKGYYDYKKAQTELELFTDSSDEASARDFLNIRPSGDAWEKADDVGQVAFMPAAMSMLQVMDKTKADYHSEIEYVFIPAPVGKEGGFAYLSPAHGIAVNKNSANTEWSLRFLDFLFQKENNQAFAKAFNIMPNTKDTFDYVRSLYDIPDNHISHLGQVTFDYDFYNLVVDSLMDVSKGNNPKYMETQADGSVALYPFAHYMELLEERVKEQ